MKKRIRKMCISAMLAALCAVATFIHVPVSATGGYVNLGDAVVILSGCILGPAYGFAAAGIGSALADIILSYTHYAPITFVIKGVMALAFALVVKAFCKNGKYSIPSVVLACLVSEIIMVGGYYICEALLLGYGLAGALASVPSNAVQGIFGIIIGTFLCKTVPDVFKKFRLGVDK